MPGRQVFPVDGVISGYIQCLLPTLAIAFQIPPEQAVLYAVRRIEQAYGALTSLEIGNSIGSDLLMANCQGCRRKLQRPLASVPLKISRRTF